MAVGAWEKINVPRRQSRRVIAIANRCGSPHLQATSQLPSTALRGPRARRRASGVRGEGPGRRLPLLRRRSSNKGESKKKPKKNEKSERVYRSSHNSFVLLSSLPFLPFNWENPNNSLHSPSSQPLRHARCSSERAAESEKRARVRRRER